MQILYEFSCALRHFSFRIRLGIVTLAFLFCINSIALISLFINNRGISSILTIPIALAAWMFKPREALIAIGCMELVFLIFSAILAGVVPWSFPLLSSVLFGALAAFVEAWVIGLLRYAVDLADAAKQQSQQAQRQLALAYEQEQRLSVLKDQFIMNISHELRTPLTEVKGFLDLLQEHHGQLDITAQRTFLDSAAGGCNELELLVNNMLETTRIDQDVSPPQIETFLLTDVISDMLCHIDPLDHPLSLDVAENIAVRADPQQLRQVIRNLLSNAFKYSPPQRPVEVKAALHRDQDKDDRFSVCICVKDAGPGIASANIPLLFQKFVRLERDIAGSVRGTGLGLYISKRFVENMGGRIWVESTGIPGEGCCFYFTLPCASHTIDQARGNGASQTVTLVQL